MKATFLLFCFLFFGNTVQDPLQNACEAFQNLNTKIRDGKVGKKEGRNLIITSCNELKQLLPQRDKGESNWTFPLKGYGKKAIGGKNGNGFITKGYDFFDGNKHGGHPAQDIFITDKNQDSKDDKSGKKVEVRSVLAGIVIAWETSWPETSKLRGGKYIMVFHQEQNLISYYAHLDSVAVEIGQKLAAGETLGLLGRTGLNAFKNRSPTHLHLMVLKVDSKLGVVPINPYPILK